MKKKVIKHSDIAIYWLENKNPFFLICPWQGVHFKAGVSQGRLLGIELAKKVFHLMGNKHSVSEIAKECGITEAAVREILE